MEILKIILYIIIVVGIILIGYALIYNKIKTQILKINSVESEIDESLREKYDLLVKIISEVKKIEKDIDKFNDFEKIKDENLSSFEFERKLADIESEIYTIRNDNNKLMKNNTFNDLWYDITNLNTKIKAEEKYYNENTTIYNELVTKFPSKLIAVILRLNEKRYFDGKNMYDKNIKDFKI